MTEQHTAIYFDPTTIPCNHQFCAIEQITKPGQVTQNRIQDCHGVRVGCALCGAIRVIWETGALIIEVDPNVEQNPRT